MKTAWLSAVLAGLVLAAVTPAGAAEPIIPFLEGLRNRGYYDTAEEYLDQIENDSSTPAEIRKVVSYQRAITLIDGALEQSSPEQQRKQLDRAAVELERFIKANPKHERVGDAQSRRGDIALKKARVSVQEARSPANAARKDELKREALVNVEQAREVFQQARDTHEKRWRKFPVYIDRATDRQKFEERKEAEIDFIKAQLDVVLTIYEEAQVYERKDPKFAELLNKAAQEFEEIHQNYRSMTAGMHARMWQGKCFEEQDEIGRALGIYNELLGHESRAASIQRLQDHVLHFKLICLNHESRKDYFLVDQAASEWLKNNRRRQNTLVGLGITFRRAVAREQIGLSEETEPNERPRFLRLAQDDAAYVNRFQSKYKDETTMMIARIRRARGLETSEPETFADAFSSGQVAFNRMKTEQLAVDRAEAAGKPKKEVDALKEKVHASIEESARMYQLGLKFAGENEKPESVNRARLLLAFLYYLQAQQSGREDLVYDAAVLAEFAAHQVKDDSPDTARDAAHLAMAAYQKIYNRAPRGRGDVEMRWIISSARYITTNWPGSKKAVDAAFALGGMYEEQNRPLLAAHWYASVPDSAKDQYGLSLVRAGQAYWKHYLDVSPEQIDAKACREGLINSVGEDRAAAVADRLNPSWNVLQRHDQVAALKKLFAADNADNENNGGGKNDNGNADNENADDGAGEVDEDAKPAKTPEKKKKPAKSSKKPGTSPKKPGTPKKPKDNAGAPEDAERKQLDQQIRRELQNALADLTGRPAAAFEQRPAAALRKSLLDELQKLSPADLQRRYENAVRSLSDEQAVAVFQEKVAQWRVQAAWNLKRGVDRLAAETPSDSPTPPELVAAKVTLGSYLIDQGDYRRVLALMESAPHAVLPAIAVEDESKRPGGASIKSRGFASLVYQLIARSHIGERNIEQFREYMNKLAKIASGGDGEGVTRIFEDLGRDLQREIERLRASNNTVRLKEESDNFSWVVGELFKHKAQLQYNTLIWIAETSYGLGQGFGDDSASNYFKHAADAYELILDKIDGDDEADKRVAVKLRLANCRRRQKDYETAYKLAQEVTKERPQWLPAQLEAAYALQGRAESGRTEKYLEAINGVPDDGIWGWRGIATRARQEANRKRPESERQAAERFDQKYLEARYNLSYCRWKHGVQQSANPKDPKRQQVLGNAVRELLSFSQTVGVIDGRTFEDASSRNQVDARERFDELFLNVQVDKGVPSGNTETIAWPEPQPDPEVVAQNPGEGTEPSDDEQPVAGTTEPPPPPSEEGSSGLAVVAGILFACLMFGGGGWFLFATMKSEKKRRPAYRNYGTSEPSFAGVGGPAVTSRSQTGGSKSRKKAPPTSADKPPATKPRPKSPPKRPG